MSEKDETSIQTPEEAKLEAAHDALRDLASYVGNGGYNAPEVDAEQFRLKVREGIDFVIGVETKRRELAERDLAMALRTDRTSDEERVSLLRRTVRTVESERDEARAKLATLEAELARAAGALIEQAGETVRAEDRIVTLEAENRNVVYEANVINAMLNLSRRLEREGRERIATLEKALRGLRSEVFGMLGMERAALVELLSLTNVRCLEYRLGLADAALSSHSSVAAEETTRDPFEGFTLERGRVYVRPEFSIDADDDPPPAAEETGKETK